MQKSLINQRVFPIVFILISGCGGNPTVQVNELNNDTVSYDETIHINNCGGKADTEQIASHSFATNIEGGAKFSAGYHSVVEGEVSAKYSQYRNISKSLKVVAPPATNMEFVLRWSEDVHIGNVTVNGETGNYEVRVPVAVDQISSQDLGCDSDSLGLNIRPACGSSYTIESGRVIELRYGTWYTDGLEVAIEHANHLTVTLFLDGKEITGTKQPVVKVNTSSFPGATCGSRDYSNAFGIFYIAIIGPLTPGEHSVKVNWYFDTQIIDGYDENGNPNYIGPGQLDPFQVIIVASP